jgi:hypothetical protein
MKEALALFQKGEHLFIESAGEEHRSVDRYELVYLEIGRREFLKLEIPDVSVLRELGNTRMAISLLYAGYRKRFLRPGAASILVIRFRHISVLLYCEVRLRTPGDRRRQKKDAARRRVQSGSGSYIVLIAANTGSIE